MVIAWLVSSIMQSRPCLPSANTGSRAVVPHRSSSRWLVYETRLPDIEASSPIIPLLGLFASLCSSMMQVSPANWWVWLARLCMQPPKWGHLYSKDSLVSVCIMEVLLYITPSTCECTFNNPPWFCKQLPQSTNADLEVRLCSSISASHELIKIYVK